MDLRALVLRSLSGDNATRREAEQILGQCEVQAGFTVTLLQLVSQVSNGSALSPEDAAVRQSMSVLFKNVIRRRWMPGEDEDRSAMIPAGDRETIKTHLVELMCSTPPEVQKMLAEAVAIVAKSDFPANWTGLLVQLKAKLATQDLSIVKGVMLTTNSIMKRFRYVYKTDPLMLELIYCLEQFQEPLTQCANSNFALIESMGAVPTNKPALIFAMETHRLINRIFFSLNWQDIPEYFEDNIKTWMEGFARMLNYKNPVLDDPDEDDEPGAIEKVQAAVVENISLYVTKYEEEFGPYLGNFTQLVWQRLMELGPQPKYDVLATSLIKYLTSVCSKQMNVPLFTDQVLSEIVSNIVVRNLTATDMDQELFEDNPTDYIRKDMEGSDQDTRRRCAVDLVRGLLKFFSDKVSALCIGYIGSMLETYRTTMDWRAKDAALHLVQAVAVKSTVNQAATEINPLINVLDIFSTHVFPEVNDPVIDARPIVKADAIKLICLFRQHFPRDLLLSLMPRMIAHLGSSHVVIQTYAAVCIDKFLSIKDKTPAGVSVQRLTEEDLGPLLQGLLAGLFAVLDNPNLPENDYVMKGIMRVLAVGGARVGPYTQLVLHKLNQTLERVCKNPVNPHFNHYMFESIALLIRNSCTGAASPEAAAALCTDFENMLFPPFQAVLQQNITEFTPYVFQVLAQLLSYRPGTASSPPYKALFSPLLSPVLWEQRGNVPALSDLFRAYITKAMPDILAGQHLAGVLGVFQKLLASKVCWSLSAYLSAFCFSSVSVVPSFSPAHLLSSPSLLSRRPPRSSRTNFSTTLSCTAPWPRWRPTPRKSLVCCSSECKRSALLVSAKCLSTPCASMHPWTRIYSTEPSRG